MYTHDVTEFGADRQGGKEELVRALKYDRDQYDKGFEDGKKAMIQLLLENDICVCRLCESNGNPLDKFPCNKCKVAWPIFGDDFRFKLKE